MLCAFLVSTGADSQTVFDKITVITNNESQLRKVEKTHPSKKLKMLEYSFNFNILHSMHDVISYNLKLIIDN